MQWFSLTLARRAVFVAVFLVAGLIVWRLVIYQSDVNKGLRALNEAYREQRPVETRFTEQAYAPFSATRGDSASRPGDSASLRRAERYADDAIAGNAGPAAHQLLGKISLAQKDFDKAIKELEQAAAADPENAEIHSDLGAALLEKGKIEKEKTESDQKRSEAGTGIEYLARSLESLKRALELSPDLLEALFNRALAYEATNLSGPAEANWREYLKTDSKSQWAQEATHKLKLIEEQRNPPHSFEKSLNTFLSAHDASDEDLAWRLISENHTSAGNLIANSLLDTYLKSAPSSDNKSKPGHDEQAVNALEALSFVASLMIRRGEDHYVSDLVDLYRSINPSKRQHLIEARSEMEKGYQLFGASRFTDAIASYTKAQELFELAGDMPEAAFASYRIAHCYVLQPNTKKGQAILEELLTLVEEKQFKWLLSQCFYQLATIRIGLSEYTRAINHSNQALKLAQDLNDSNGTVKILIQLAEEYRGLNNRSRTLGFLERSLIELSNNSLEPSQAWQSYIGISINLSSYNFNSTALEFQKEALRIGTEMDRPLIKSRSYQYLGLAYANLKRYDEAIKHVQQAIEIGRALVNEPNGMEMVANASVTLGNIYQLIGNHTEAIAAYDQSLQLYAKLDFPYFSYFAYKGKLLSYIAQGDDKSTGETIQTLLDLFKRFREKITEQSQRNTFFDAQQDIYDLAIDFEHSRQKNYQRAFDYSEASRGRSLRDLIQGGGQIVKDDAGPQLTELTTSDPLTFSEIQTALPADTNIVQYSVLPDKLLIWAIRPNEPLAAKEVLITAQNLHEKIQAYRNAVESNPPVIETQISEQAKELSKILIEPVESSLSRTNLCIVPDKSLHYLPFASLVSLKTGKYLFDEYRLQLSPSSTLFLDYSRIANSKGSAADERLLTVGDPEFDHEIFPTLPDLPSARREAETIAEYYSYKTRRILIGKNATKRQIETEVPRADVIHLAAHYVADAHSEMLSKLVLARERNALSDPESLTGTLLASEIYAMNFPRTRLVVLAACRTGIERQYKGEGAIGLARPFLAGGVPLAVASLWPVETEATTELMIRFHRYRKQVGMPAATALQQAQRDMLKSENPIYRRPFSWASFVAIGGHTTF